MKTTLTIPKADLRRKLEAKIEEVLNTPGHYEAELIEVIEERKTGETREAFADRTAEYHRAIAAGLADGSITLSATGRLSNSAPPKPKKGRQHTGYEDWSAEHLERELKRYEKGRQEQVKPLQAALELLEMSSDDSVEISSSDYQEMLSIAPGVYRY